MKTWLFAHNHAGNLWEKVGIIMIIVTAVIHIPLYFISEGAFEVASIIITAAQVIILILSSIPTEKALKNTFNADGTRKNEDING